MREPGYYWVKCRMVSGIKWTVLFYTGKKWRYGSGILGNVDDVIEINETRILNPDEVQSIAQSTE